MTAATGTEGPGSLRVGSSQPEPVAVAATVAEPYDVEAELTAADEPYFAATVGMFVGHASRVLAELRANILAAAARDQPADAIASVRRSLHALQVEFGLLDLRAPQQLCRQAEATVAAGAAVGAFPAAAIRASLDLLQQWLERLAGDPRASCDAVAPELRQLWDLARDAAATEAALAGPAPLVELQVVGDFAASRTEFVIAAQRQLALAAVALAAIASEPDCGGAIHRAGRAMRTIQAIAGFLQLDPLLELAAAAANVLEARASPRHWAASDSELMLAAAAMTERLLGALDGKSAPERRQLEQLLSRLRDAAMSPEPPPASAASPAPSLAIPKEAGSAGTGLGPTTVDAGQVLSFWLGEHEYALAVLRVRAILGAVDVTPLPGAPGAVLGVMHWRGAALPVLDLRRRCGLTSRRPDRTCTLVVEVGPAADPPRLAGCVVDAVGEVLAVGVEPCATAPRGPEAAGDCSAGLLRVRGRELRQLDLECVVAGLDLAALLAVAPGARS